LNNFTNVRPILEAHQCPATFFITGLNEVNDNILWADYVNIASTLTGRDIEVEGEVFFKKNKTYYSQLTGKTLYTVIKQEKADYAFKQKVKQAFSKHVSFENEPAYKEYWQLMSDQQITEVSKSKYIKIGSHAYYHNNLGSIPHQDALDELGRSKKYLENLVQYSINQLAYPDGSYTPELVQSATQAGFQIQLADRFLFNEADNSEIKRRYGIYTIDTCLNQLFTAIKNE
jgi:peptidoglycan/xylan/chitin deacetylase (PgdA/CDA1 family)